MIHVANKIDPLNDAAVINLELVLADAETVGKRLVSVAHDAKRGVKAAAEEETVLRKIAAILEQGQLAQTAKLDLTEKAILKPLNLLTMKPMLYVANTSEAATNLEVDFPASTAGKPALTVKVDSVFEAGLDDLIKKSYELLGLITYFTTGADETRAWTIKRGSTAPEAGAAIHTDFKDKFIRAEVIAYDQLLAAGSYTAAREKGLLRIEGRDYVVKDGDVIEFRI